MSITTGSQYILAEDMCIDVSDLKNKVASDENKPYTDLLNRTINELCSFIGNKTSDEVNEYCYEIMKVLPDESETYFTLDNLRMAFFRYIFGGLTDLFTYQENEGWWPKIVLDRVIDPNDIDTLDDEVIIYRGCDISEYNNGVFGQSWSTNEDLARVFAYKHYSSQEWYDESDRVVLWAIYDKTDILYSNQTEYGEFEVVVKNGFPKGVEVLT